MKHLALILLLLSTPAWAACTGSSPNWTTTPDQASFTTCWNDAVSQSVAQNITVSAGTATWSSTWAGNPTTVSITVTGATTVSFSGTAGQSGYSATWGDNSGTCSGAGTCITGTVDSVYQPQASNNAVVRTTGITWINNDPGTSHGIIGMNGTHGQVNFRFDHNHLLMYPLSLTIFAYDGYGLIDHNEADDTSSGGGGPWAVGGDLNTAGYLNWQDTTNPGTNQGWVVEQNIINFTGATDGAMDAYYGAKFTFRFNNVTGTNSLSNGIGWNHGTDSGGYRSTVLSEIYGNYFNNQTGGSAEIGNSRGGEMLYWGNTHAGNAAWTSLLLQYFRCLGQNHSSYWGSVCNNPGSGAASSLGLNWTPVSNVDTTANSALTTLNAADWQASHSYAAGAFIGPTSANAGAYNFQNEGSSCTSGSSRPSFSQTFPFGTTSDNTCTWTNVGGSTLASPAPGTAAGFCAANPDTPCAANSTCSAIHGGDVCTTYFDTATGVCQFRDMPGCSHNQVASPNYEWKNSGAEVPSPIYTTNTQTSGIIAANSDYYSYVPSGFTGATGVGSGTLASAPATCTQGVGYFATDQGGWNTSGNGFGNGVLYVCGASNNWVATYTPYSYPYPMAGGSTPTAATPAFSPPAGTYTGSQAVILSTSSSGAIICYTASGASPATNGSTGCTTGTLYSTAISVSASETLKAVAGGTGYTDSSIGTAAYTINASHTYTAATCNYSDVNAVINGPTHTAVDGDTIVIPAGSCTWGSNSSSDVALTFGVNIILQGQGTSTVLTDNMSKGGSTCSNPPPVSLISATADGSASEMRITNFEIIGETPANNCGESANHISIQGTGNNVRVDHITYNPQGVSAIGWGGSAYGVIDHNTFQEGPNDKFGISLLYFSLNGVGYWGDNSWAQPDSFGNGNNLYVENNTFSFGNTAFPVGCFDEEGGGRIVFRFNTGCPFVGMHGLDSSGRARSGRQWEVYNNAFTSLPTSGAIPNMYTAIFLRGGTGYVFNNTFTDTGLASYITLAQVNSYRSTNGIYPPWGPGQSGEGCDGNGPFDSNTGTTYASGTVGGSSTNQVMTASGSPNWSINQWAPSGGVVYSLVDSTLGWGGLILSNTANTITVSSPAQTSGSLFGQFNSGDSFQIKQATACADQIGRGAGLLVQDSSDTNGIPVLASTSSPGPVNQALDPAYEWLNSLDGTTQALYHTNMVNLQQNRDYYDWTGSFTGASGVGTGVLASRPTTCTVGAAYWATDQGSWNTSGSGGQGELFKCTSPNTWTLSYTPYTYPHPLVSGGLSPASTPTFSPVAGTYTGTQSVSLSTSSAGAIICWNTTGSPSTNGTTGCSAGTLYSGAITVPASETIYAVAGGTGYSNSGVGSADYVIRTTASVPTFSPAAGTYNGAQNVTLASSGSVICYNFTGSPQPNGSTGCTTGTVYTAPVVVSSSQTLYASAGGPAFLASAVGSAAYVIDVGAATPTFSPVAGTYTGTQSVTLATTSAGAVICYTTNGATPATNGTTGCAAGTIYSTAISVAASETIKAVAGGTGYTDSSVGTAAYVIKTNAATPTFSPVAGTYPSAQTVTIGTSSSGAILCYTTNGSTPSTNGTTGCTTGTLYTAAISVASSETLKSVAGGTGYVDSSVGSAMYVIRTTAASPTFSPPAGTFTTPMNVAITTTSPGAIICYNSTGSPATNGSTGCTNGTLYTGAPNITSSQTLYAVAGGSIYNDSPISSAAYVIRTITQSPAFSPAAGSYVMPITVTISVPSPDQTAPLAVCYTVSATCVPGSTGTQLTQCVGQTGTPVAPCNVTVNPAVSEQICATATAAGKSTSTPVSCSGVYLTSTAATGDGRGVQSQPSYPAVMFATGCTKVAATQAVSSSTAFNVDPWNPTISTSGSLGGSGGTSLEPASEADDTTLQSAINSDTTGCVRVTLGGSGQQGLVEGTFTLKANTVLVLDPGVIIFMSRKASDFTSGNANCGILPTGTTGVTTCHEWITIANKPGAWIMGDGVLDGRCWDTFSSGGTGAGFCSNRVQTLCDTHSHGPWAGVTCPTSRANNGIAYGPDIVRFEGTCTNCNNGMYNTILKDAGGFNVSVLDNLSGFTAWGLGVYSAAEVSNSDGIDFAYGVTDVTSAFNYISVGDNAHSLKANSSKAGGAATSAISILSTQTGANAGGVTLGYESSASSGSGIFNVLVNGLVQYGSNNNPTQQVGHGIHSDSGEGGTISQITYENSCVANEQEYALQYDMSDSGSYSGVQDINETLLGTAPINIQGASGRVNTINLNNVGAGTLGSHTFSYTTFDGQGVSFNSSISGTGVTNNITGTSTTPGCTAGSNGYPSGNPVAPASWQPIHGDLTMQIGGQSYYTSYTTANASQAIVLQAVIRPTMEINTQEMTALTQPVAFYDNGTLLGTGAIGGNGTYAHYSVTATTGSHTYTARYSGDSGYPGVVYNFGSVTVQVGSSSVVPVGPIQFQGTVVVQ